jgi:hypothetical protein
MLVDEGAKERAGSILAQAAGGQDGSWLLTVPKRRIRRKTTRNLVKGSCANYPPPIEGVPYSEVLWLGYRDSNANYLIQSCSYLFLWVATGSILLTGKP